MDKKVMYQLTYGLFVVTAKEGEKINGCITNTAMQVTSSPNRISLTVNKSNYTHDMIVRTGEFNVTVLSEKTPFDLFKRFGFASGRDTNKFEGFSLFAYAANGIPYILQGANAYLSGSVVQSIDLGTHTMFIADVTDGETLSTLPSVTYGYYQKNIKPAPVSSEKKGKTVWRCKVCGYEYEGEELPEDFICPLCKHGAEDFEKVVL